MSKALIPLGVKRPRTGKYRKSIVKQDSYFPKKIPKFLGYDFNQVVSYTNPYIACINATQQGNTNNTRIGGEALMTSVQYKAVVHPNSRPSQSVGGGACNQVCAYSISIVYDKSPQGALPSVAGTNTSIFNGTGPHDLPLFDMSDRYVIIMNEVFTPQVTSVYNVQTSGSTAVAAIDWVGVHEKYKKISLRSKFNVNDNGNITDFNIGAIYLILRCDDTLGSIFDNRAYFNIDTRVRFKDV